MFAILLIVLAQGTSTNGAAVTSQMIGQYATYDTCETIAGQLRQSYVIRDGLVIYTNVKARCVQVK